VCDESSHDEQIPAEFKEHAVKLAVESDPSQAVRATDLRRARYIGVAKTPLHNLVTAAALNLLRVAAWLAERPRAQTRLSPFAALASGST
jgi:transposase